MMGQLCHSRVASQSTLASGSSQEAAGQDALPRKDSVTCSCLQRAPGAAVQLRARHRHLSVLKAPQSSHMLKSKLARSPNLLPRLLCMRGQQRALSDVQTQVRHHLRPSDTISCRLL